jgi:competence protein ComEC
VKKKHTVNNEVFTPTAFKNPNNNSIVSKLIYGSTSLLFTGDLEKEGQDYLMAKYHDHLDLFNVDFYHVGHHGEVNGTTQKLLDVMSPKIALISAGDTSHTNKGSAWDHGHPRTTTVELLNTQVSMSNRSQPQTVHAYLEEESIPQPIEIKKDIYCTCWSGSITMQVSDKGKYAVM